MNNIGKRMEINTALMLYKVLVRSIFDYRNMIFLPDLEIQKEKMEKVQFQGLRTALGYRNSTPKNVILEEAKVVNLRERAVFLAKNKLAKLLIWGREELKNKIFKMENNAIKERYRHPRGKSTVLSEAWRRIWKDRGIIDRKKGFDVFKEEYEALTWEITTEINTEVKRKEEILNDYEMIQEIMENNDITWENTGIIYTDGSKKKNTGKSTGVAFIFEEEEQGFYLSINRRSTIFIAEVVAITKGIQKYEKKIRKKIIS